MRASSPRLDIATHPTYRPEIDGLRAIAVIGVVLFHVGAYGTGGFAGVDVFFVISGYLITSLLLAEQAKTGRVALAAFYARRVRRLLPALLVVVLATVGAATFVLSAQLHEVQDVVKSAAASLTFVSNVLFYRTTGDYFSGHQLVLFDDDEHISRRAARGFAAWWLPAHGNGALSAQAMARDE